MAWSVREFLLEMLCDLAPRGYPDPFMYLHILHEITQRLGPSRFAHDTTLHRQCQSEHKLVGELAYLCIGMFIIFPPSRYNMSNVAFKYFSYMSLPTNPGLM